MKKLILASSSKYRKELLSRLGIPFDCIPSNVDEDEYKEKIADPEELALALAYEKAKEVFEKNPDAIVIGSDQLVYVDNKVLGKTGNFDDSVEQLYMLQGETHFLMTAYCILSAQKVIKRINKTTLKMKNLSDLQIKNYLSQDKPFDCAGSYKLELKGISLFDHIDTIDHTAIIGLPLISLGNDLAQFNILIPPEK